MAEPQTGVLIINLGTPGAPNVKEVRRFLREFLSDPFVIDLPWVLRQLILNCFILPFRPKRTAALYQKIWTEHGSPLLQNSQQFSQKLADILGDKYHVALGMRYGNPSIKTAFEKISQCEKVIIFPLFPQYSQAATATAVHAAKKIITKSKNSPALKVVQSFFDEPFYIDAMARIIQASLYPMACHEDLTSGIFILFSYHGLPERALSKAGCKKTACDRVRSCLAQAANTKLCYRAQCFATSAAIAAQLNLTQQSYATVFQSRLGRAQWIRPYAEAYLQELAARGIKRLLVACPSFVADCLETLEEVNIRLRLQWQALGGEAFQMVPCLNADPFWVQAAAGILTSL